MKEIFREKYMNDLISIIVPVYKVEPYLNICVKSIVAQTYTNLEIILVDDGSPDKCPSMCDEWAIKDSRIKVIHKQNGGLSDARNAGMASATGDYIAFVDSDDWIERHYIEYLYQAIQRSCAEISACKVREVPDGKKQEPVLEEMPKIQNFTPEEAIGGLTESNCLRAVVWNKLYKRDILKDEHFIIGRMHEDEFFSYRIFDKASKLVFIDIPLYNYRQRTGSIMSTVSACHIDVLAAYLERVELLERKYPNLVARNKIIFCITCVNLYCDILSKNIEDKNAAKQRIKEFRKKVHFTNQEWKEYSLKEKIYAACSGGLLIEPFCRLRILRGYR